VGRSCAVPRRRRVAISVVTFMALVGAALTGFTPAAAISSTGNFVNQLYEDFLYRPPTIAEYDLLVAALDASSITRADVVNLVIGSSEFVDNYIAGVYFVHLGRTPDATELTAARGHASSGLYHMINRDVLSGTEFFNNAGGTNTGYVTALYDQLFHRSPDSGGLAYWTGQLASGALSRSQVANFFLRSNENTRIWVGGTAGPGMTCEATSLETAADVTIGSYCLILKRPADVTGRDYWVGQLSASGQLPILWRALASSNEYYNAVAQAE